MRGKRKLAFKPLTSENWDDFEKLFGPRGACAGCWCMWWRLKRSEWEKQKGEENKKAMKKIVDMGKIPGIIAYAMDQPVGWCAVAPRETYGSLNRSRILKPIDDEPVWSIVCFFVQKNYRKRGLTVDLINAVIAYVNNQGGKIVEAYPVEPGKENSPDIFLYTGLVSGFKKSGFKEVARRSPTRPIMRYVL